MFPSRATRGCERGRHPEGRAHLEGVVPSRDSSRIGLTAALQAALGLTPRTSLLPVEPLAPLLRRFTVNRWDIRANVGALQTAANEERRSAVRDTQGQSGQMRR